MRASTVQKCASIALTLIILVSALPVTHSVGKSGTHQGVGWISNILSDRLSSFQPKSHSNSLCDQHVAEYEKSLRNLTLWAVQMKEASAKGTEGMLVGQRHHIGHYDECVAILTPTVAGRYCLVDIRFAPTEETYPNFYTGELDGLSADFYSNAWENMKKSKKPTRYLRNSIAWGLCVPSACSRQDVEASLNAVVADVRTQHGISIHLRMNQYSCSSKADQEPIPQTTIVFAGITFLLTAIAVIATMVDLALGGFDSNETGMGRKILKNFSAVTSLRSLVQGQKNKNVLDGLKFISTIGMIIVHRSTAVMYRTMNYYPHFMESYDGPAFMPTLVVDSFFVISGFLIFLTTYSALKRDGLRNFPILIVNRWLRFLPPLLFGVLASIYLLPYMGDGPHWKNMVYREAELCKVSGWKNIFTLNNFNITGKEDTCLFHHWSIAADLHFYALGILIVYLFTRNQILGLLSALSAFMISILIPFTIIYVKNLDGVHKLNLGLFPEDRLKHEQMKWLYFPSYSRAGPYFVGILAAFVYTKIQEHRWAPPRLLQWLILIVTLAVCAFGLRYGFVFYEENREYNRLENALFGCVHRSIWGLGVATIIVYQLAWGFGGTFDLILTHPAYVPLSRMGYAVLLIHPVWQTITTAESRSYVTQSYIQMTWMVTGDILISYLVGLWLYLVIEGPFSHLKLSTKSKEKEQAVRELPSKKLK